MSRRKIAFVPQLALVLSLGLAMGCGGYGKKLEFNGGELYYTSSVDKAQAEKLGQYLEKNKFFDGTRKSVQLNKSGDTYQFRMVVKPEYQQDSAYIPMFRAQCTRIARDVFPGETVELHICDERLKTLQTVEPYSSLKFKEGEVFYSSPVVKDDAERVGQFLVDHQYFDDVPKTVLLFLSENEGKKTYQLKMVVQPGTENNELALIGFRSIQTRLSQTALRNEQVDLDLCDLELKTLKTLAAK